MKLREVHEKLVWAWLIAFVGCFVIALFSDLWGLLPYVFSFLSQAFLAYIYTFCAGIVFLMIGAIATLVAKIADLAEKCILDLW